MKRNLIMALGGVAVASLGACSYLDRDSDSTVPIRPTHRRGLETKTMVYEGTKDYDAPTLVMGNAIGETDSEKRPYGIESLVIGGKMYRVNQNTSKENTDERPFIMRPVENERIRIVGGSQAIIPETEALYVFEPVTNPDGTKAHAVTLKTQGAYGVKAAVTTRNLNGIGLGIVYETQKDLSFNLRTIKIGEIEFYTPIINDNDITKTPFLLVPKADRITREGDLLPSDIIIDRQTGEITLYSVPGIWRGKKMTQEEWSRREDKFRQAEEERINREIARRREEAETLQIQETNPGAAEIVK